MTTPSTEPLLSQVLEPAKEVAPAMLAAELVPDKVETWFQKQLPPFMKEEILGLHNWQWIGLGLTFAAGLLVQFLAFQLVGLSVRLTRFSRGTWMREILQAVQRPVSWLFASLFWFLSLYILRLEGFYFSFLSLVLKVMISFHVISCFLALCGVCTLFLIQYSQKKDLGIDRDVIDVLGKSLKFFVVVFGALITIQNLGVNVMSVIAGLGLGGLALALAAKDTAANLFGSVMIFGDRPFRVGDYVKFSGIEGNVESIGFRSTRIRTPYDSLVTIPNATVANANIDNLGRRQYRRLQFILGLTYDTPSSKLARFTEKLTSFFSTLSTIRQDHNQAVFFNYSASSLDVQVTVFIKPTSAETELDIREKVLYGIAKVAEDLGIGFAFPTQSLYVESLPGMLNAARTIQE